MRYTVFFFCFLLSGSLYAQSYKTETLSPQIKSLQVRNSNNWYAPAVIEWSENDYIEIVFDELSHNFRDYYYSIVHCNADWTPSMLSSIEYLTGFDNNPVEDYATSFNTQVDYTNYRILLPNDRVGFKVSGNYVLSVYEQSTRNVVLRACFSVIEKSVTVGAKVTGNTDIDSYKKHQQLSVKVNYAAYPVQNALTDLHVYIFQNNRPDNNVKLSQAYLIGANEITYEHSNELIFEAGNEFRRFECVNFRYNGLGVNDIKYFEPYTHVVLERERPRNKNYSYDQDQNGRYLIRTSQGSDDASEGEYMFVHFLYPWEDPLMEGSIHLNGELTNYLFNDESKMVYSFERKAFEKSLLLKQGSYNYQYLFLPARSKQGQTSLTEGNFHETENEYRIMVYHRPFGGRYDKLVGMSVLQSGK